MGEQVKKVKLYWKSVREFSLTDFFLFNGFRFLSECKALLKDGSEVLHVTEGSIEITYGENNCGYVPEDFGQW